MFSLAVVIDELNGCTASEEVEGTMDGARTTVTFAGLFLVQFTVDSNGRYSCGIPKELVSNDRMGR